MTICWCPILRSKRQLGDVLSWRFTTIIGCSILKCERHILAALSWGVKDNYWLPYLEWSSSRTIISWNWIDWYNWLLNNYYLGTFYLEFWKREEAGIQFLWDVSTFTGEEVILLTFLKIVSVTSRTLLYIQYRSIVFVTLAIYKIHIYVCIYIYA